VPSARPFLGPRCAASKIRIREGWEPAHYDANQSQQRKDADTLDGGGSGGKCFRAGSSDAGMNSQDVDALGPAESFAGEAPE
jgi:hypothetical protein